MEFPIINVALFWNKSSRYDDKWNSPSNTLFYEGQLKRKTMDSYFERPNTFFYIFEKKSSWAFVGKARSNRRMKCRVMDKKHDVYVAPVWEMSFEPVSENAISEKIQKRDSKKYLSKRELFDLLEFVPAFVSMTTGIIPFKKQR